MRPAQIITGFDPRRGAVRMDDVNPEPHGAQPADGGAAQGKVRRLRHCLTDTALDSAFRHALEPTALRAAFQRTRAARSAIDENDRLMAPFVRQLA